MKKTIPLFTMIVIITFIITGLVICAIFMCVDSQKSEKIRGADQSDSGSNNGSDTPGYFLDQNAEYADGLQISDRSISSFDLHHSGQMDLNEIAVYNGMISEISVSPTIVTYDYNHDGIVDLKKTILFFNIG